MASPAPHASSRRVARCRAGSVRSHAARAHGFQSAQCASSQVSTDACTDLSGQCEICSIPWVPAGDDSPVEELRQVLSSNPLPLKCGAVSCGRSSAAAYGVPTGRFDTSGAIGACDCHAPGWYACGCYACGVRCMAEERWGDVASIRRSSRRWRLPSGLTCPTAWPACKCTRRLLATHVPEAHT